MCKFFKQGVHNVVQTENGEQREEDLQRSKLQQSRIVWVASLLIR